MGTNVLLPDNSVRVTRGTSKSFKLSVTDLREETLCRCSDRNNPPPLDLTGATIHLTVKKEISDRLPVIKKASSVSGQIDIINAKAGQARINLDPEDTQNLEPGFYVFDVWVVLANGKRYCVTGPAQLQIEFGVTFLPL
jgi:hypothetical protein